ncbi:MAG: hypothetical protein SFV22_11755 [Saprospiraceae bacterium]|nr:hypothetical protein [Saprospiraceae bacterium]
MAQINWVFLDDFGGRHRVGLYHGDRTGHVMIHCNMRVVQIDFSVKDSKMYSFFIEDELCEVILDKKDGVFGYEFRVNKKVDTPRNRVRRVQEGKTRKSMALLAGGLLVLLTAIFFSLRWFGQEQEAKRMASTSVVGKYSKENMKRLAADGKRTVARLHLAQGGDKPGKQHITYTLLGVDSLMEQGDFYLAQTAPLLLPNGFPCSEGDEFEAIYLPADPGVHRIDFFQPVRSTINRYMVLAIDAEKMAHPAVTRERCVCRVLTTAEKSGWSALANFIFQETPPEKNKRHNQDTYLRLVNDPDLSKALAEECAMY